MGKTMILKRIFARKPELSRTLYEAIVAAARRQKFYLDYGVADTIDGRFDMITLHLFLVLDRLRDGGPATEDFRQQLTDGFFTDMDRSLREMGVGDLSVGKKVRKMAEVFYGRVTAYSAALERKDNALTDALARNVYADAASPHAAALKNWVKQARAALVGQDEATLMRGEVQFP
jgi:cytochrome b pre-mRNA-processing protein 3